jgi:hypothetical protein
MLGKFEQQEKGLKMKQLMENWRRLLREFDNEEEPIQYLPPDDIPLDMYHAIKGDALQETSVNGLKDFRDEIRNETAEGVSFTYDLKSSLGDKAKNLILVFDGKQMAESGQYRFRDFEDAKLDNNTPEIRMEMIDSASDTGSGVDIKVDTLGTEVPFRYVKKMVFTEELSSEEQKFLEESFPTVALEYYNIETDEIKEYGEEQP